MKTFLIKNRSNFVILALLILSISGLNADISELAKSHGHSNLYPTFFLATSLTFIYIVPFVFLTLYLKKRFNIPSPAFWMSWFFGLAIPANLGSLGNSGLSFILLNLNLPKDFIDNWGGAFTAPFTEEISKGLVVLLIALLLRQISLKSALVMGMIAGMGFQIVEDRFYIFQDLFQNDGNGYSMALERIASSGVSHWVFSGTFALGLIILMSKTTAVSKKQGVFFLLAPVAMHFMWNSPLDFSNIDTVYGTINWLILLYAFKTVDALPPEKALVNL